MEKKKKRRRHGVVVIRSCAGVRVIWNLGQLCEKNQENIQLFHGRPEHQKRLKFYSFIKMTYKRFYRVLSVLFLPFHLSCDSSNASNHIARYSRVMWSIGPQPRAETQKGRSVVDFCFTLRHPGMRKQTIIIIKRKHNTLFR